MSRRKQIFPARDSGMLQNSSRTPHPPPGCGLLSTPPWVLATNKVCRTSAATTTMPWWLSKEALREAREQYATYNVCLPRGCLLPLSASWAPLNTPYIPGLLWKRYRSRCSLLADNIDEVLARTRERLPLSAFSSLEATEVARLWCDSQQMDHPKRGGSGENTNRFLPTTAVSVSYGCCNNRPQTRGLRTTHIYYLAVQEV